jgi:hypothetical protein
MAGNGSGKYDIPDFKDAPIEVLIGDLRKGIASDCAALLAKAREVNAARHGGFDMKRWEARLNRIRESQAATYDLEELQSLKKECQAMSAQLGALAR